MEALIDTKGSAADRALWEDHLRECAMCAAEVEDLRGVAVKRPPRRVRWWLATAAAIAAGILVAVFATRSSPVPARAPIDPIVAEALRTRRITAGPAVHEGSRERE